MFAFCNIAFNLLIIYIELNFCILKPQKLVFIREKIRLNCVLILKLCWLILIILPSISLLFTALTVIWIWYFPFIFSNLFIDQSPLDFQSKIGYLLKKRIRVKENFPHSFINSVKSTKHYHIDENPLPVTFSPNSSCSSFVVHILLSRWTLPAWLSWIIALCLQSKWMMSVFFFNNFSTTINTLMHHLFYPINSTHSLNDLCIGKYNRKTPLLFAYGLLLAEKTLILQFTACFFHIETSPA
jgi:hypothetical protein